MSDADADGERDLYVYNEMNGSWVMGEWVVKGNKRVRGVGVPGFIIHYEMKSELHICE